MKPNFRTGNSSAEKIANCPINPLSLCLSWKIFSMLRVVDWRIPVVFPEWNVVYRHLSGPLHRLDRDTRGAAFRQGGELGSRSNSGAVPATVVERKPRQRPPDGSVREGAGLVPRGTAPEPGNQPRVTIDRNGLRRAAGRSHGARHTCRERFLSCLSELERDEEKSVRGIPLASRSNSLELGERGHGHGHSE